jgi:hypothetical protein
MIHGELGKRAAGERALAAGDHEDGGEQQRLVEEMRVAAVWWGGV